MSASILHPAPPTHVTGSTMIAYVLLAIFLILVLAAVLGGLMTRIGQPRVVGEILAGVLLGPTVLGADLSFFIVPAEARPTLAAVSTIGLVLFMFLAGVEFDRTVVRGREQQAAVLALLSVAVPVALGLLVALAMHDSTYAGANGRDFVPFAMLIGATLSVTAFPVMAHILMERGELNSPMGALAVATTGIMSVIMFLFLALAGVVATSAGFASILLKLGLAAVFMLVSWLVVQPALGRVLSRNMREGGVAGVGMTVVFAGLVLYGLIGDRIGISAIVGGFAFSLLVPHDHRIRQAVSARMRDITLILFVPVFFAFSGFNTDLKLITPSAAPILLLFLAAAIGGKFLAALPARWLGLTWMETSALACLLNARGLLVLVAGLIGLELEIITLATFTIIVVVALVTTLMTLPLLNLFARRTAPRMGGP